MLEFVVFLFLSALNLLVSANPVALIPIQKCAQSCNQNGGQSFQTQPNPQVIPVQIPVIHQPGNNQLYPQTFTIQNPMNNQNQDPVNQLNQMYLNKILSNGLQGILDPVNLYGQYGIDNPAQHYKVPNTNQNVPCTGQPPHIVNNYFILPPEYFENTGIGTKRSNTRSRDRDSYRDNDTTAPERRRLKSPDNNRRDGPRRLQLKDEDTHSVEDRERYARRRRPDGRPVSSERDQVRGRQQHKNSNIGSQERERSHVKHNAVRPDVRKDKSDRMSSEKSSENVERQKKTKKSRDDAVIEEFRKKFPIIPEEVVRKLLSYLRHQLSQRKLGNNQFQRQSFNFPLRYEQLFPKNNKNRNPNRNPSNPIARTTPKPETLKTTTNPEPTTTDIPKTNKCVKGSMNKCPQPVPERKVPNTTPKVEEQETTTNTEPDLGSDVVEVGNRIIDDYYPDFTKDNAYYESGEAFNIRNLRDDRYVYTTDRNYEPTTSVHDYYIKKLKNIHKSLEDVEDVLSKPDINRSVEELEYRTPPLLYAPDFKTKQIIRKKPDHINEIEKDVSYKSSIYSDSKMQRNRDVKSYKSNGHNKKAVPDSIETVYGHSKVVKYGKNEDSGENDTPVVTYYLPDNMQYEDDGKTIIIAKSIPADHFW